MRTMAATSSAARGRAPLGAGPGDLVEDDDGQHRGAAEQEDRRLVGGERAADPDPEQHDRDRQPPHHAQRRVRARGSRSRLDRRHEVAARPADRRSVVGAVGRTRVARRA